MRRQPRRLPNRPGGVGARRSRQPLWSRALWKTGGGGGARAGTLPGGAARRWCTGGRGPWRALLLAAALRSGWSACFRADVLTCCLACCHSVDPFTRKEWYDVKAPSTFAVRNAAKTCVNRTSGTSASP